MGASPPEFQWAERFGGTVENGDYPGEDGGNHIALDREGNSYVTGFFSGGLRAGAMTNAVLHSFGLTDVFVAKFNPAGELLWVRQGGGPDVESAFVLAVDQTQDIHVTGLFRSSAEFEGNGLRSSGQTDIFFVRYDKSGNLRWVKSAGGPGADAGRSVAADSEGHSYFTGYFAGTASFDLAEQTSQGGDDVFLAKFGTVGNLLWVRRAGGKGEDQGLGVAVDGAGNCHVAGLFSQTADFQGTAITSAGDTDFFVAKYDPSGNLLWVQGAGGSGQDGAQDIALDSAGNSYVTGFYRGTVALGQIQLTGRGMFLIKFDPAGKIVWARRGSDGNSNNVAVGVDVIVDAAANSYVAGVFKGSLSFGDISLAGNGGVDGFLAKYDRFGNLLWSLALGGGGEDAAYSVAGNAAGDVRVTGAFSTAAQFGNFTLASRGTNDAYVASLKAEPSVFPPMITGQPQSQKVKAGSDVTLAFAASGSEPFQIQWRFNGQPLAGATNRSLILSNVRTSSTGAYSVSVSNAAGSETSQTADLVVFIEPVPPIVSDIPDQTARAGQPLGPLLFTISDTGTPADQLNVTVASTDAALIPNLLLGGEGENRSLILIPAAHRSGSATIEITVTDFDQMSVRETFRVTVEATNQAPMLAPIPNQSIAEGSLLEFTAAATDPNVPAQTLTFTLESGAPAGASVDPITGRFSWRPAEDQGPGNYFIGISVTDNGTPPLSASQGFTVSVQEINLPPVLASIDDRTIDEGSTLQFLVLASDPDLPAQRLSFSLDASGAAGATLDAATGAFHWIPTEEQGPGEYRMIVRVSDSGSPSLAATNAFTISVREVNAAPSIAQIPDQVAKAGTALTLSVLALDPDLPAHALEFSLDADAPPGARLDPATGIFTWMPPRSTESSTNVITVRVTDGGTPRLSATNSFRVISTPSNFAPSLAPIPDQRIVEGATWTLQTTAADSDIPSQSLVFSLEEPVPDGLRIDAARGVLTWTPTETQGPGTNRVTVRVRDDGSPPLSAVQAFTILVSEMNTPPIVSPVGPFILDELSALVVTNTAADLDWPPNKLAFSLLSGPGGIELNPDTGVLTWTPTEAQGPDTYPIRVKVTDDGTPSLSATNVFLVNVHEVNSAPVLSLIPDRALTAGETLRWTSEALDFDIPANTLSFQLVPPSPAGATLNAATGEFIWALQSTLGGSTNRVTIQVTDDGTPPLSDRKTFTVVVREQIHPPAIVTEPNDQTVKLGDAVTFGVSATGSPPLSYQWRFNGEALAGATNAAHSLTNVQTSQAGLYSVRVTNPAGSASSREARLTVETPATNSPPRVRLLVPADRAIIEPGQPVLLEAEAIETDPGDRVERVLFSSGTVRLGEAAAPPYRFAWPNPGLGDYLLTAQAVDSRGAVAESAPVRIAVSEVCGQAALISDREEPETRVLQEALFELGVNAKLLTRSQFATTDMAPFDLLIWMNGQVDKVSAPEIAKLRELFTGETALYFIGGDLVAAGAALTEPVRAQWSELIHLSPLMGSVSGDHVSIITSDLHPVVVEGKVGSIQNFAYAFSSAKAEPAGFAGEKVLARSGNAAVLIAYEDFSTSSRSVTQLFGVGAGGEESSEQERRRLFQNAAWWLLHCRSCSAVNLRPTGAVSPELPQAGQTVTYTVQVRHSGECEALGVTLTSRLPAGLQFQRAMSEKGQWKHENGLVTFSLGRMGGSAAETLQIVTLATRTGVLTNVFQLRSFNESSGALLDNDFVVVTEVRGQAEDALQLSLSFVGPQVELAVQGPAGRTFVIETSTDLRVWRALQTLELTGGRAVFLDTETSATRQRMYRARIVP